MQHVDLYTNHRLPDRPRPFLEVSGADAARPGCEQDKNSADFLVGDDLKFWMMAVDTAAIFLGCTDDDRTMMQGHLIEQGWAYVLPLRGMLVSCDLPIIHRPEFQRLPLD